MSKNKYKNDQPSTSISKAISNLSKMTTSSDAATASDQKDDQTFVCNDVIPEDLGSNSKDFVMDDPVP